MTMRSLLDLHVPDKIRETRLSPNFRDLALMVARLGLAWLFIYHGASTLFGAFHGAGIHRTAVFFANYAHLHPGTFFAVLNGITEFFGGIAIALGVCARLAAVGLVVDMVIAMITVTWHNGIVSNAVGSGYELNIALACLAGVVASLGSGRLSFDYQFRRIVGRTP
ncbi:MAG TPA: DoxX family protein [Acidimicrobiales bacterium]|jgi:putative oxidoreductase